MPLQKWLKLEFIENKGESKRTRSLFLCANGTMKKNGSIHFKWNRAIPYKMSYWFKLMLRVMYSCTVNLDLFAKVLVPLKNCFWVLLWIVHQNSSSCTMKDLKLNGLLEEFESSYSVVDGSEVQNISGFVPVVVLDTWRHGKCRSQKTVTKWLREDLRGILNPFNSVQKKQGLY